MTKPLFVALCALCAATTPAEAATRNFAIASFERVRIDGPYRVHLLTGVAPFATATGSAQALDAIALDVQGSTLVVHVNRSAWGGFSGESTGPVTIDLGTHDLSAAWLNGSGSLAIDRVSGLGFDLSVQGSGSASIDQVSVDQFRVGQRRWFGAPRRKRPSPERCCSRSLVARCRRVIGQRHHRER